MALLNCLHTCKILTYFVTKGYGPPGEKKMRQDGDRSGLDYIKQEYDDKGNSGESQASGQVSDYTGN